MGKKRAEDKQSHQVRVHADLGDMISGILEVEGEITCAQLLDPMLRAQITARFKKHEAAILKIRAARLALEKVQEEVRSSLQDAQADDAVKTPPQSPGRKKRPE